VKCFEEILSALKRGNIHELKKTITHHIDTIPFSKLLNLSYRYFEKGDYSSSYSLMSVCKEALRKKGLVFPPEGEIMLSRIYQELGLWRNAELSLKRAELKAGDSPEILASIFFNRARINQMKKRFEKAIKLYKEAIKHFRNSEKHLMIGRCYLNMALASQDLKKSALSLFYFKKVLKYEASKEVIQFINLNMGLIYLERKRFKKAIEFFKRTLEIPFPNKEVKIRALSGIGDCLLKMGKSPAHAFPYYKKAFHIYLQMLKLPPSPYIISSFLKEKPRIFNALIHSAIQTKRNNYALKISSIPKALTLVEKIMNEETFPKKEVKDSIVSILTAKKLKKENLFEKLFFLSMNRLPLKKMKLKKPDNGECMINFQVFSDENIYIITKTQRKTEIRKLEKTSSRHLKRITERIKEEVAHYGEDAFIEEELQEIRNIMDIKTNGIGKISISPSSFLNTIPWKGVFPHVPVEIYPSFLYFPKRKIKFKIPFLFLKLSDDLLWVDEEFKTLKRIFPEGIFLSGKTASRKNFLRYAPLSRIIHIAGHSSFEEMVFENGIVFPDGEVLSGYEIILSEINAELLSFSSCETARGKIYTFSGEMESLTYAFLLSGVERVIGSYFSVDDRTSYMFFKNFYTSEENEWELKFHSAFQKTLSDGVPLQLLCYFNIYRNIKRYI
jgi:tetratricopeptide (TPR) repeat protein